MADEVPVCDVLCEAMEYLSKLGSNLRVRSENLKEKKIRKDRLKNTHAVQKAANKVLLICELSKKSLENVETGVKNLLSQIDLTQSSTSSAGKRRRPSTISNTTYEYFEYASSRLRIREKICLNHYTSVKVIAKPMPSVMLKEYPVYHDCKLYRQQKKEGKLQREMQKDVENIVSKLCQDDGYKSDRNLDDNSRDIAISLSEFKESTVNKDLESDNNLTIKSISDTDNSSVACTNFDMLLKESLDKKISECGEKINVEPLHDTSGTKKLIGENKELTGNENSSMCQDKRLLDSPKNKEFAKVGDNEQNSENINSKHEQKSGSGSESSEIRKPFIKCVNTNKLLKDTSVQPDNFLTKVNANELSTRTQMEPSHKETTKDETEKNVKKRSEKKSNNKNKSDSTFNENYQEQRIKELKLFKPKEFAITIHRLPNFSIHFLKAQGLNKITQNGYTLFELGSALNNKKDVNSANQKCPEELAPQNSSQIKECESIQHLAERSEQPSEVGFSKFSLLNDSDSDKSDKELLDVAQSVRNALLRDSDSDKHSEFENNISSTELALLDKNAKSIEVNMDNKMDSGVETIKASLLNDSSDNNSPTLPNEKTNVTIESESKSNEDQENKSPCVYQDPEKIKSALLNDSSDNSSSNPHKKRKMNEDDQRVDEDPENVKSLLLNDSSDNTTVISLKRRKDNKKKSPLKSKRKHIMESMHAKKMLLTYSSSSDTEDEQLRNVLKEIKQTLLEEIASDKGKNSIKTKSSDVSNSDSEKDDAQVVKTKSQEADKATSSTSESEEVKLNKSRNEADNRESNTSPYDENTNSSASKMGRSRAKSGSSSSQNSDSQDANDKVIYGLTNLRTLRKTRRRRGSRSSTDRTADTWDSKPSGEAEMPKAPRIKAEALLKAETSSDAASIADSEEGAEAEELPTVSMSAVNGEGITHLAKDDLLGDSDSSTSQNDKSNEGSNKSDSEEETVKARRRAKGPAISSDSEAGASRRAGRGARRSDFEDSDEEGSSEPAKKRRKKKTSDSDGDDSADSGKKKRRRIKNVDDSEASDSDTENEGRNKHGRKNIRKVMGKNQLEEATKKAAREEKERIARIAERQKLYNNLEFDESGKPDEVVLEKVVLDFDPETKEPLIEVDRGLVKKLKPHQANGIKFMWDACFESAKRIKKDKGSGCILAHCMGLGKTLQVVSLTHTLLTHGELTSVNRVLVVCPLSTVLNWVNEFRIWLKHAERDYEVDVYELSRYKQNSERAFQLQQWFEHGGVCVLGYEMFRNLSADNPKKFKKKMLKNFQESLVDPGPDLVVCDEGHLLKNEKTSLSQSMNRVKTLRRIVLTGTPLQNNLKEYYCMVQFVKPNLLGKYNEYLNRFVNPITNGQYTDSTEHDIRVMKRRSHVLHKMLDGAVQRRDYGVLAPFLPPKHEYVLFITLTEVQIKLYQHYLDNYSRRPLPGKSSGFLFPDFQSLQRIWTHPLVMKYNSERYEIMQQKKREREEEDSEGSLVDFIDDDSTPDESSTEESSDDFSDVSDDSRKKSKKKKAAKKGKGKDSKVTTRRGTRANPVEQLEEEEKPLESLETKYENPTEWWIKLMNEDELEDMRNSHKLVLLFDILRQCEAIGDKLLVFSQSLYSLDLIEHFLGKVDEATQEGRIDEKLGGHVGSWSPGIDYFRLDGSTSCENRSIWCKNFNREDNPRARLFLISTRAGGLGINLVAANRVVIFDVSWNPSHDVQSIFRVYRFGQKKPCYIYRFLAMGTMEEKIYERQVTKQAISKRVIDEQQIDRHYAENDLAELYKFEPRPPAPRPLPPLPKDRLFAEMLREHDAQIYKYHEHDSLLENKEEETLSEEERKAAWEDFENEKNRPPPAPFPAAWQMPNGMMPGLLAHQQQQLAYAALGAMLRKDIPNINENQIREMLPLLFGTNAPMFGGYDYGMMQKMSEMYKYPQPGMMNSAMMNSVMNPGGGAAANLGGSSSLQYEPPWLREQKQQQQQMRLQQMMQQQHQNQHGAKFYAGGLGSRDPVAMALQQQRAREIMLGERAGRPRGRPPLQRAPATSDVVNLDSD